eukprot:TRINITY_DN29510_c0_g1_i1.p1 TRINITY_DN29510_c0_g1~~TRINITY_DN29510_c0_g1_i1.p1  ORF type:complete len:427 (-),score=76.48 TRINITY_DN29510_c0_g1_i1:137-1417(-)
MIIAPVLIISTYWVLTAGLGESIGGDKKAKALSVFSVVSFPNMACDSSTSGRNGTCYTNSECAAKGGSSSGSCASSFGVCCVFEKTCGDGSVGENNTYFLSTGMTAGSSCSLTICKSSSDVCQLRLDFETFALNNPVTVTTITSGSQTAAAAKGTANSIGRCETDTFTVTTCGGKAPPVICGTNTGAHMYISSCSTCNTLNANFGSASTAGTSAFTIKVTQIECSSKTLAPSGCLQYFTGTTGQIDTFNYNSGNGAHLANQDYSACVRAERTICSICYYQNSIFALSVPDGLASWGSTGLDTACGVPGFQATFTKGNGGAYDHIIIPDGQCNSPITPAAPVVVVKSFEVDRYCGTALLCSTVLGLTDADSVGTVCSMNRPFKISIKTDDIEYAFPATASEGVLANARGFGLGYFMQTSCLTRPAAT